MKKYIKIFTLVLLAFTVASCNGFLDTVPTDSGSSETAMLTMDDAQNVINSLYAAAKSSSYYGSAIFELGEARADDMQPKENAASYDQVYKLDFSANNLTYFGVWNQCYNIIMRANTVLENWESIPASSSTEIAKKNDFKGQALAVRALCYFDLARLYGSPYTKSGGPQTLAAPLILKVVAPNEAKVPRNTVAEVYAQVETDLTEALGLLSKAKNNGRFNYYGAKMLQAKVHLYKGEWDKAYTAATEVINSGSYSLVSNASYLASWGSENNAESIFELTVTTQSNVDSNKGYDSYFHYLWTTDESLGLGRGYGSFVPSESLLNLIQSDPDDVRNGWIQKYTVGGRDVYCLGKFPGNPGLGHALNNLRVFRLSEAYFIAAEAGLKASKSDAKSYLDAIIVRANPDASTTYTFNEDAILTEKRKEFAGEGHRFFDMMRLGKTINRTGGWHYATNVGTATITNDDYRTVLPISASEIAFWGGGILVQNPGY